MTIEYVDLFLTAKISSTYVLFQLLLTPLILIVSVTFYSGRGGGRGGTPASAARKGNIQEYKGTKISFDD